MDELLALEPALTPPTPDPKAKAKGKAKVELSAEPKPEPPAAALVETMVDKAVDGGIPSWEQVKEQVERYPHAGPLLAVVAKLSRDGKLRAAESLVGRRLASDGRLYSYEEFLVFYGHGWAGVRWLGALLGAADDTQATC